MEKYIFKSATELAKLIANNKATSRDIVKEHIDQIKKHNNNLNAIVQFFESEALEEATACDEETKAGKSRGPLHGVPFTVKEQFWVKGTKSTINTNRLKDWIAPEDAKFVSRIKKAGGILLGKSNAAKDLLDFQTHGDIYPTCNNPYNRNNTPGGSSGGAGAALASGMIPLETGGDFGGSIRIPANFCGVFGLRPTENTIPGHGNVPIAKKSKGHIFNMAVSGPMARTAEDVELLWKIVRGPDKSDRLIQPISWKEPVNKKITDYKIAWVDGWPGYKTSDQNKDQLKSFVALLAENGVETSYTPPTNNLHQRSLEVYKKLAIQMISQELPWFIKAIMIRMLKSGFLKGMKKIPWKLKDSFLDYSEAMGQRAEIIEEWESYFEKFDLLICPAAFGPAFPKCKTGTAIEYEDQKIIYINYAWPYNACFNASGHPALSLPLGLGKEELPMGVQVVGPYWSEPDILHFAKLVSGFNKGFTRPEGY